jgi:FKBP-type peptidyl-prolyl cis-trans isomerase FkpA
MNKLFLLFAMAVIWSGCGDLDPLEQFDKDVADIEAFLTKNNITNHQKTPEGIYYIVNEPGTAAKPNILSTVTVKYTGTFLDLKLFDSSNSAKFQLSQVIEGWQIGIPKFGKGGKGKLIIPSRYAYGEGSIDGRTNQVLIFDIEILDFVN